MKMHTILGAGGAVANELFSVLKENNENIRLVSRNPPTIPEAITVAADMTNYDQALKAINGSSIVYFLVGLPYDYRIWKETWPKMMANVINACKASRSKLIFFDNVYMYGKVDGWMTEETPFNPCSRKGEIRANIARQLLNEMKAGNLEAMIARSADFYGPVGFKTSVPNMLVFDNLRKNKRAQWLANPDLAHSFTFVPDAAKALHLLALDNQSYGTTWHLPTASNPFTGRQFIKEAAKMMNKNDSVSTVSKLMMRVGGLFDTTIREANEMNYQYGYPYLFGSDKFNNAFKYQPLSYEGGIKATVNWIATL